MLAQVRFKCVGIQFRRDSLDPIHHFRSVLFRRQFIQGGSVSSLTVRKHSLQSVTFFNQLVVLLLELGHVAPEPAQLPATHLRQRRGDDIAPPYGHSADAVRIGAEQLIDLLFRKRNAVFQ